jgi:hypothetical protein
MKSQALVAFVLAAVEATAKAQGFETAAPRPKPLSMPKLSGASIPFGPAPTGCNAYEVLIGELELG